MKLFQTNCVIEFCKVALRDTKFTNTREVLYRSLYLQGNNNLVFIEIYLFPTILRELIVLMARFFFLIKDYIFELT